MTFVSYFEGYFRQQIIVESYTNLLICIRLRNQTESSLSIVIAFLSVTRVTIAFGDYIAHRGAVQAMSRAW